MTVKVDSNPGLPQSELKTTITLPSDNLDINNDINSNNVNNIQTLRNTTNTTTTTATAALEQQTSLDSVVQRLIDKKMGRRKQNCPQRTGLASEEGKNKNKLVF